MATEVEEQLAYEQLRPYANSLPESQIFALDEGLNAGESYLALSWLIADLLENNIDVPKELLLDAYNLLSNEDKEEYRELLPA